MCTGNLSAVMPPTTKKSHKNPGIYIPLLFVYQIQETNRKNCHQKLHTAVTDSERRISF